MTQPNPLTSRLTDKVLREAAHIHASYPLSSEAYLDGKTWEKHRCEAMRAVLVAALGPLVEPQGTELEVEYSTLLARHQMVTSELQLARDALSLDLGDGVSLVEAARAVREERDRLRMAQLAAAPLVSPPGERTPPTPQCEAVHKLAGRCDLRAGHIGAHIVADMGSTFNHARYQWPGLAPPSAPPPAETLTCLKTGNECGTDAWMIGADCKCANCQRYQHSQRYNRAAEAPAETPRETCATCRFWWHSPADDEVKQGARDIGLSVNDRCEHPSENHPLHNCDAPATFGCTLHEPVEAPPSAPHQRRRDDTSRV